MKNRRRNLHWGDIDMAELELEKLICIMSNPIKPRGNLQKLT